MGTAASKERGQGLVESAIALPIFLLLVFMTVQIGWVAFCTAEVDSGIAHLQRAAGTTETIDEVAAKQCILDNSIILDAERMQIQDYEISYDNRASDMQGDPETDGYLAARRKTTRAHIKCTVIYDAGLLVGTLGNGGPTTVSRDVDFTEVCSSEFEVR